MNWAGLALLLSLVGTLNGGLLAFLPVIKNYTNRLKFVAVSQYFLWYPGKIFVPAHQHHDKEWRCRKWLSPRLLTGSSSEQQTV